VTWLDGHLFSAPVSAGVHSVLDLGCGSGAWTLAVAAKYPAAQVLGVDLTPPQKPDCSPSNCRFEKANVEHEWTFVEESQTVDIIYARMLANGMHDWPKFFSQCFAHLHPGGWIEIPDVRVAGVSAKDGSSSRESPAIEWFELFRTAAAKTGVDPFANGKHSQRLRDAGFVNIRETPVEWLIGGEIGATAKEKYIGDVHLGVIHTLITGATESLLQYEPGADTYEVQALAARAKQDLIDNQGHRKFVLHLWVC